MPSYSPSAKYVHSVVKITSIHAYIAALKIQKLYVLLQFLAVSLHILILEFYIPALLTKQSRVFHAELYPDIPLF